MRPISNNWVIVCAPLGGAKPGQPHWSTRLSHPGSATTEATEATDLLSWFVRQCRQPALWLRTDPDTPQGLDLIRQFSVPFHQIADGATYS